MSLIAFRPAGPDDDAFLQQVYASTRQEELAPLPWTAEQKSSFLRMQFEAQHRHYHQQFPDASFQIILRDGVEAGRLYVDRRPDTIHVIDIALLPSHRGAGIGTSILRDLMAEGDLTGRSVTLYVERFNPALRLYERLGFRVAADSDVYLFLERRPGGTLT